MSDVIGYEATSDPDRFVATFESGPRIAVRRERDRAYPGLSSPAPGTGGVYRAAAHALADRKAVVDVGCGAGAGARALVAPGRGVTGVEPSEEGAAFARVYAPSVRVVECAIERLPESERFDAATVVDVLGLVHDPRALLAASRAHLLPGGLAVIAEPRASLGQKLHPPARRAFTPEALEALAVRAGLRPDASLASPAEFVALMARPAASLRCADALALAEDPDVDLQCAIDAVALALESAESTAEARELLLAFGALHLRHADADSAAGSFVGALRLHPGCARGLVGLGAVAEAIGRHAEALRLYERATRADPLAAEAWRALGVLRSTGATADPQAAASALENALCLEPASVDSVEALARVAPQAPALALARARLQAYQAR